MAVRPPERPLTLECPEVSKNARFGGSKPELLIIIIIIKNKNPAGSLSTTSSTLVEPPTTTYNLDLQTTSPTLKLYPTYCLLSLSVEWLKPLSFEIARIKYLAGRTHLHTMLHTYVLAMLWQV